MARIPAFAAVACVQSLVGELNSHKLEKKAGGLKGTHCSLLASAAGNARVTPDQEGDREGLRVTTRDGEKGEGQQCVRACACACACVSVFAEWMGKERGPSCINTQGGECQGEGEGSEGPWRLQRWPLQGPGGPESVPSGGLEGTEVLRQPLTCRVAFSVAWRDRLGHKSQLLCTDGDTVHPRRPRQGNARGVGRQWVPPTWLFWSRGKHTAGSSPASRFQPGFTLAGLKLILLFILYFCLFVCFKEKSVPALLTSQEYSEHKMK